MERQLTEDYIDLPLTKIDLVKRQLHFLCQEEVLWSDQKETVGKKQQRRRFLTDARGGRL